MNNFVLHTVFVTINTLNIAKNQIDEINLLFILYYEKRNQENY